MSLSVYVAIEHSKVASIDDSDLGKLFSCNACMYIELHNYSLGSTPTLPHAVTT